MFKDETGRDGHARRLLRQQAGRAGVRLLPVPDALLADAERHLVGAEGAAVHAGQGLRRRARQLRSARHAGERPTPRSARISLHWSAQDTAAGWHFLTGDEAAIRQVTSAAGFTYQWDETTRPVRARQRPADADARRPAVALLLRRRVLAEGAAPGAGRVGRGPHRLGRSRSCCCTASSTTRRPAATAWS